MAGYDLVIVGAGAAGTSAALSAAETAESLGHHVRIVIVERANENEWGGNSRYTEANLRMLDEKTLYPTFEEDILSDAQGRVDRDYLRRFVAEAVDAIAWVRSKGVTFELRPSVDMMTRRVGPVGGGLQIITALLKPAEDQGVSILFETTACGLSTEAGRIDGVFVRSGNGKVEKLSSRAIILAGGGFEGNAEMLTRYVGRYAAYLRQDVPATRLHMGECIGMAFEVGAKPSGDFGNYHGAVVDTRSNAYRPRVNVYAFGILVNVRGERFVDEGVREVTESFEIISRSIFNQPSHKAYVILDQKLHAIPDYKRNLHTDQPPIQANTITELAEKIGVPSKRLAKTLADFNGAVQDGKFDPSRPDGKMTVGIEPPKSNWAIKIDQPPYLSYPVEGTVQFTWGGVATDFKARVLATNDAPIPGLYAAGEMVGIYYHHYTGATSVLRALTYGRIAGSEAVRWLTQS